MLKWVIISRYDPSILFNSVNKISREQHPMYIDPGSGSVLVQIIIGALLSIGVAVRLFWSRIKTGAGGQANQSQDDAGNEWTKKE
jgi:hypothetical protein